MLLNTGNCACGNIFKNVKNYYEQKMVVVWQKRAGANNTWKCGVNLLPLFGNCVNIFNINGLIRKVQW